MTRVRFNASVDSVDLFYGLFPAAAAYAAFVSWASLIVRAIRGEDVEEDWRTFFSSAALMASFALVSGARVRQTAALRGAALEMRELVREAADEAQRRDQRVAARDRRDSERQDRLTKLTRWLVALAALTLVAAVVTLVVSTVNA